MKTITKIWTIISLLGIINSQEGNASELQLSMWNNAAFSVKVDHRYYSVTSHDLVINNLDAGNHYIVVYQPIYNNYGRRVTERLAYSGYINIPAQSMVTATIDRRNLLTVRSITPHHPQVVREHGHKNYHYNAAMNPAEFRNVKKRLMNTRFESEKRKIMEYQIEYNFFTSQQVFELVCLFDFESDRVEVAKQAYHKTIDKQNYHLVFEAFEFSSSRMKLERYITHNEYR